MIIESIAAFASSFPLLYNIIIIVLSLILLSKAASYLVQGISSYAKKLGVSDYLVGTLVVALAASTPELLSSMSGISQASSGVVFGTLFGSNFVAITFVIALVAIFGKKVKMNEKVFHKTKWDILLLIMMKFLLLLDGKLTKIDGVILLSAFVIYLFVLWKREGQLGKIKKNVKFKSIYKDGLIFILSLVTVLLAARFLVHSSLAVSGILNINPFLVSVVLIGIGAQTPDLILSLRSTKTGHQAVALGDILGSMIIQSLLFFGIFALIRDLEFPIANTLTIGSLVFVACITLFTFLKKKYLTRRDGLILLTLYAIFIASQFFFFS